MVEDEDKSLKASHITLIGVLKTPKEDEEVERIKKRRRIEEQPRETISKVEAEGEFGNEERGFSKITQSNQCSSPPLQKRQQLH